MLELDLVIGKWAKKNIPSLNLEQCQKYQGEVLDQETPELYRKIIGVDPEAFDEEYLTKLREFAQSSKSVEVE